MLDTRDDITGRYHIEFGKAKSKVINIGGGKTKAEFKLGEMNLEYCSNYKYLRYTLNEKNNISDYIQALKGNVETAY